MSLKPNTLYYGDCLEWLPRFPSESVDHLPLYIAESVWKYNHRRDGNSFGSFIREVMA